MKGPRASPAAYNIGTHKLSEKNVITSSFLVRQTENMNALILAAGYGTRLQRDLENDSSGKYEQLKVHEWEEL